MYWRRRLLLLAAAILVVWLVVKVWPSGGSSEPKASPTSTASAAPSSSASASSESPKKDPQESQQPTDDGASTTVSLPTSTTDCDVDQVRIVPSVAAGQRAHEPVTLDLAVSTSADKPCTFTPTASSMLAVISAGSTAVWDSSVCRTGVISGPVTLSPEWSTVVRATWNARGSGGACSSKEGWATPGSYTLEIGTLGGEPGQTSFRLAQPKPKPKPTKTPSKKPTAKKPTPSKTPTPTKKPTPTKTPSGAAD